MASLAAIAANLLAAGSSLGDAAGNEIRRPSDTEIVTGTLVGQSVECPVFLTVGGERITLSGALGGTTPGQELFLSGRWTRLSHCMQGRTFHVVAYAAKE